MMTRGREGTAMSKGQGQWAEGDLIELAKLTEGGKRQRPGVS